MQLRKKALPDMLAAILIGLGVNQSVMAETRTKYFSQSGTVNGYGLDGAGGEVVFLGNDDSGIYYSVALSAANGVEDGEERYISVLDLTIGKSYPDGWALFGGLTINSYELYLSQNYSSYGYYKNYDREIKAGGLFVGLGVTKPFGPGVFSASASVFSGNLYTQTDYDYCYSWYSGYSSHIDCYSGSYYYEEPISGLAYTLAYAIPITNSITFGLEHRSREFSSTDYIGMELKMNRVFLDIAFR
jgi:hypothetical protein